MISIFLVFYSSSLNQQRNQYSILSFKYYLLQTATNAKNQKFCMARTLLNKTHEMNSHVSPSRKFSRNLMQNYIDFKGIQSSNHIDFSLSSNDTITNACCLPSKKSQIIIGTKKGYLIWYDIDKNKMIKTQKAHDKPITALMSQPDMNILVSASNDGILKLWSTTKSISEFKKWSFRDDKNNLDPVLPPENFTDNENQSEVFFLNDSSQFFFTMTHDARYIAYGSDAIIIRDLKTNKFVTQKPVYTQSTVNDIALFSDKNQKIKLAIATNNDLRLWISNNETLKIMSITGEPLRNLVFTGNGKIIGSTNKSIYEFAGANKYKIEQLNTDIDQLYADNHDNIITVAGGKTIIINNLKNKIQRVFDQHQHTIVSIIEIDKKFLSIDKQGGVEEWSFKTDFWKEIDVNDYPSTVKFSNDGSSLLVSSSDGGLISIQSQTLKREWKDIINGTIDEIAFSSDKKFVAIKTNQETIIIDTQTNKRYKPHIKNYKQMRFMPQKNELLLLQSNSNLIFWNNIEDKATTSTVNGLEYDDFDEKMVTLTIPPDGTQIIMGSTFGNVYFVSYPELNLVQKFQISKEPIKHLSHDTTGNIILCTNKVDEIFIINRNAPESYSSLTFIAHQSEMLKALFLYQDEQIVSVDKDRKMHFWDLPTETELFHIQLPVPSMSDAVTDFDCYCESYNNCIFAVGLRNNKVAVHQFSVE